MKAIWIQHVLKTLYFYHDFFRSKSFTWNFVKKLPTLGTHDKTIPDPEPTLPEGLLPDLPDPTRGIDSSLLYNWICIKKYLKLSALIKIILFCIISLFPII